MKNLDRWLLLACFFSAVSFAAPENTPSHSQSKAAVYDTEDFGSYKRDLVYLTADLDGSAIPVYVAYPKGDVVAVAVLLHGITGHKDLWWQGTGPYSSRSDYTQALLKRGIAVAAMDARYHGQRAAEFGYRNPKVELFYKQDLKGLHKMLSATLRDTQTLLRYIKNREDLRALPVGVLGDSMGGILGFSVAAQGNIDFLVSLVAAPDPVPSSPMIHKLSPMFLAPSIKTPVCVVLATQDVYYSMAEGEAMFEKIPHNDKKLIVIDEPHDFQNTHADEIAQWIISAKQVASIDS